MTMDFNAQRNKNCYCIALKDDQKGNSIHKLFYISPFHKQAKGFPAKEET
jgi:hypothetical protein